MKLIRWVEVHIGRRKKEKAASSSSLSEPASPHPQPRIRTSLLTAPADSPRPRPRIRTNPWLLPSPRADGVSSGESRTNVPKRLPRVTLDRSGVFYDEDTPYCPVTYCRPIPRSAWMDFRELTADLEKEDAESSDEAYSEDYVHLEDEQLSLDVLRSPGGGSETQTDSACGSCGTTPLGEPLADKVCRLRGQRAGPVEERLRAARSEEVTRRDERLQLQRELVHFRRLLLLQTLADLRSQLERDAASDWH